MADEATQEQPTVQSVTVSCGADQLIAPLTSTLNMMTQVLEATKNIESKLGNMYEHLFEMADVIIHIHDAHLHWKDHFGEDKYDVGIGAALMPPPVGHADRLITEYNNMTDMDGNGLIFGKDFIIDPKDEQYPIMLKSVTELIPFAKLKYIKRISWTTYLKSLPGFGEMEGL